MELSSDTKEIKLIERCINGDQSAEWTLYKKYVRLLYNVVIRMSGDPVETEDILQDTFVKVFKNLSSYKPEFSFKGWIKKIAVNTAISSFRKKKFQFVELDASINDVRVQVMPKDDFDLSRQIHQAIKRLPNGSRIVFNLFAIEGYSHKEIGAQMNISESTSKTQYRRAKKLLKDQLNPIIYE